MPPKAKPKAAAAGRTRSKFLKGMIYAPQGNGKTHLAGTASFDERMAPLAFLDFEGGDLTLDGMPGEGDTWELIPVRSWDDYNEVFERLQDGHFKSCAVDSLSETHIFALFDILEKEGSKRKNPNLIEQGDYGTAMVQIRRLVREFRDLPMHVLFLASAKDHKDPREGMIKKPSLSGQLADDIPGMLDLCGYLAKMEDDEGETYRSLILQNYPGVRTKVRMPWGVPAPDEIDNPDVTKVLDALKY